MAHSAFLSYLTGKSALWSRPIADSGLPHSPLRPLFHSAFLPASTHTLSAPRAQAFSKLRVVNTSASMDAPLTSANECAVTERVKRPMMLCEGLYSPPIWASHLQSIPSHFYSLGHFPTPIHRWNLPNLSPATEVWIKRDDLTGLQLSGNKVRKLEFLFSQAKAEGADCVITIGGIHSNHCRATAVAARYLNLDCYLILRTSRTQVNEDPGLTGNLLVERMVGAFIELVSKEDYQKIGSEALGMTLKERLVKIGRRPYVIPVGGSNSLGTWGYIEAVREVEQQIKENAIGTSRFDDIVMACGSGATTAGLALGSHLSTLQAKVHAYAVCDDPDYFYDYTQGLLDGLSAGIRSRDIVTVVDAKGLGYAMSTVEELKYLKEIAETTGVILDPVYSGKALFGMFNDMRNNPEEWTGRKVLFIHTGGLLCLYDKVQQLQPLMGKWQHFEIAQPILQDSSGLGKMF
eukprot:c25543_g1_i1 orf=406-1788(-)